LGSCNDLKEVNMSVLGMQTGTGPESSPTFYRINTDGGIVAEQGQAAGEASIGVVLRGPDGSLLGQISERIGWARDHHIAEYRAFIAGLRLSLDREIDHIQAFLDSALVVNQVNGDWRLKAEHLRPLCLEARTLVHEFADVKISWVPRKENWEADALAGRALGR
jgi:ribonuclease HI